MSGRPGEIRFSKLSGAGNDFVCIDNREGWLDGPLRSGEVAALARAVCARALGVGADGMIVACAVSPAEAEATVMARFFEPDGSEAELCGNGTGCFVRWLAGDEPEREMKIATPAGLVRGRCVGGDRVKVCIPLPAERRTGIVCEVKGSTWTLDHLVTGVPHVVAYVDDLERLDVTHWGPKIRQHEIFAPRGVNVNFVRVLGTGRIAVRTYEFGVEDETLACGTGASAAAILTATRFDWPQEYLTAETPVEVTVRSGEMLRIWFAIEQDDTVKDVCLETVAWPIYEGIVRDEFLTRAFDG